MTETNDLKLTLSDVVAILSAQGVLFHLTGGLASSFYGEPRFTQDIDIVIRISVGEALERLIAELSHKFIVDRIAIEAAVLHRGMFQALHEETMIKVDFHVGEAVEGELSRSKREEILSGLFVPLVAKEDAILSKLIWVSKGSHKSRQDIKMMLKQARDIDHSYLNYQAAKLGVEGLLSEFRAKIGADIV